MPSTFLELVTEQIGVPYVYGGDSPSGGFDCSGLVQWAAGKLGVSLPRGATDQMDHLPHVDNPVAGDLVFFNTGDGWRAGHVGICANSGCSEMIDAPHSGALVRRESTAGFGQVVAYGRLPDGRGQLDADAGGGPGLLDVPGQIAGEAGDLIDTVTDPIGAALEAIGSLPGKLLEVLLGGHTVSELALRFVEIVGGALIMAAGGVTLLVVIAEGGGQPARAARAARGSARTLDRQGRGAVRTVRRSVAPGEPRGRRGDVLSATERRAGQSARQAGELRRG